ncbi:hypothetical protein [Streptomyces sp. NPDC008150]|uniref:hypothetical protein n=1 Tax=Streptomyces sp. NPDC008150 TaxID=3364816 RepID=UPI0036EB9B6A
MGFFDKLNGTRRPAAGVAAVPAARMREALLGVNRSDAPYVVRDAPADDTADLVAEWRMTEPRWHALFLDSQMSRAVRIRMRLVAESHEVRVVEEQREVRRVGNPPRMVVSSEVTRGPSRTVTRYYSVGGGTATQVFRYDSSELRDPLRNIVLGAGWTWRGVLVGKP